MNNKHIQQQRMKEYFIGAARELLESEGVQNISVRKIAEKAGYSYATIYNYFENLDHLLYHVSLDIFQELAGHLRQSMQKKIQSPQHFKDLLQLYANYYFERPHLFHFLYFHRFDEMPETLHQDQQKVDFRSLLLQSLQTFVDNGLLSPNDLHRVGNIIAFHLHGMILMCLSGNADVSKDEVKKNISDMVDYLINDKGR